MLICLIWIEHKVLKAIPNLEVLDKPPLMSPTIFDPTELEKTVIEAALLGTQS